MKRACSLTIILFVPLIAADLPNLPKYIPECEPKEKDIERCQEKAKSYAMKYYSNNASLRKEREQSEFESCLRFSETVCYNKVYQAIWERHDREEAERLQEEAKQAKRKRQEQIKQEEARLAKLQEELAIEMERQARLESYCNNGHLYFKKTWMGLGQWVEEDELTKESRLVSEFDLNNVVLNRLLELQSQGWRNKIPARTVACGEGNQSLYDVLR